MIAGFVRGQTLRLSVPRIAADTIDYLTAKFLFQSSDWDELEKWVHFALGDAAYDIRLTDDEITADAHLNLTAGKWTVYLHGNRYADGRVIQRVTTETQTLDVFPTGTLDGEPFPTVPPSAGEQIIASAEAAEAGAKEAAAEARQAADEAAQYEPEVFWAEYGVTPFADVAAAYDAGKLCGVRYHNERYFAIRSAYATERFIEYAGTSYLNDHRKIRVTASGAWSKSRITFLAKELDVIDHVNATSTNDKVPTAKATYDAIKTYSDPAIAEALRKAKESGEFDGEAGADGADGITPHIGDNGNWYLGETDTGIAAQGNPGRGITSVERTSGTGAAGTTDTYTITYTDGTTSTFSVYNGKNGANGTNGTSVTVTKVTESTEDGGSNVMTFSDGKTLTVKNGKTGAKGDPGDDYILTDADKEEIAGMIPGGGSGESDIFNVTLTTNEDGSITASHTSQEIYAAAQEGKTITSLSIVGDGVAQNLVPILINANYAWFYFVIAGLDGEHDVAVTIMSIAGSDVSAHTVVINQMTGASANSDGTVGLVPQPLTGQQDYILHGDGAWRKPAETISSDSADTEIPSAKAVYDAIQAAIPDSGDSSGSSAGVVIISVLYTDGQATMMGSPAIYPDGANALDLLEAGQARMLVFTPPDNETEVAKKLGVLDLGFVDLNAGTLQFTGTITGKDGNEAVMAEFFLDTNEITIIPVVQNSAGSGGGGIVTITANDDGTYSSSHTPAEIAAMAETGAVVAVMENALGAHDAIPLYKYNDSAAVFKDIDIDNDIVEIKKFHMNTIAVMEDGVVVGVTTIGNMTGASASKNGDNGLVPKPSAGQQDYVLHGDGTWRAALSEEDKTDLVTRVIEKLPTWEGGTY